MTWRPCTGALHEDWIAFKLRGLGSLGASDDLDLLLDDANEVLSGLMIFMFLRDGFELTGTFRAPRALTELGQLQISSSSLMVGPAIPESHIAIIPCMHSATTRDSVDGLIYLSIALKSFNSRSTTAS